MIKNTSRYIEGDFDAYVKRIQQPFVWGGEPELLMASHVLKYVFIYVANLVCFTTILSYLSLHEKFLRNKK